MKSISFNQITGASAIGSLILAALAAFTQAFVELRPFIEHLTSSSSWGVFITVPMIILTYLIGQIVIELSNLIYDNYFGLGPEQKYRVLLIFYKNATSSEIEDYKKIDQLMELYQGGSLAVLILALGLSTKVFTATNNIGDYLEFGRLIFGGTALVFCGLSILLFKLANAKRGIIRIFMQDHS